MHYLQPREVSQGLEVHISSISPQSIHHKGMKYEQFISVFLLFIFFDFNNACHNIWKCFVSASLKSD